MSFLQLLLLLRHLTNDLLNPLPDLFLLFLGRSPIGGGLQVPDDLKDVHLPHLDFFNDVDGRFRLPLDAFPVLPFLSHLLDLFFMVGDRLTN